MLVPLAEKHLDVMEELVADPEALRFTRIPVPTPPDFARSWLGRYERGRLDGTSEAFAVVEPDGEVVGLAMAPRIDRDARTVELGYLVAARARGRGVATQALQLITEWAFAELGALRLELLISVENDASKRVAARAGFVREGVLRSAHFKQGLREDTEIWSRLPID